MFNLILALAAGILIGWNFHSFFLALDGPKILRTDVNISEMFLDINNSQTTSPTLDQNIKEETPQKTHKPIETSFYSLLHNGLFSEAMTLYQKGSYELVLLYRTTLDEYFKKENLKNQEKTIEEMLQYIEIDPENEITQLFLSEIYKERKEYKKSIQVLNELIERNRGLDNEVLYSTLIDTSRVYIELLQSEKSYQELQSFLETQIALNINSSFFTLALAEHHIFMQSFSTATILLKEVEFDEEYGEKAKILLDKIEKNETSKKEYEYSLPLKKKGSHFTIDVEVDNIPLSLLLDTGATLTLVNEEKLLSSLTLINEHVTLKTAGGEISAQLEMAQNFTVGEVELENFKVTTSSFTHEDADGLLGMNFFRKFNFKIDQEKELLHLSKK